MIVTVSITACASALNLILIGSLKITFIKQFLKVIDT